MHLMLLSQTQLHVFPIEHAQREREARNHRLAAAREQARHGERPRPARRGFAPRIAAALGMF